MCSQYVRRDNEFLEEEMTQLEIKNERLRLEFQKLRNWANDEDETDGFDVSDFIDHINSTVKDALEGVENE